MALTFGMIAGVQSTANQMGLQAADPISGLFDASASLTSNKKKIGGADLSTEALMPLAEAALHQRTGLTLQDDSSSLFGDTGTIFDTEA